MLFTSADWQVLKWLATTIHLWVAEETKSYIINLNSNHFLVSSWYVLKQLFTSMSVKVVDIHLAALRHGKFPPLFTSTSVTNFKALNLNRRGKVRFEVFLLICDTWNILSKVHTRHAFFLKFLQEIGSGPPLSPLIPSEYKLVAVQKYWLWMILCQTYNHLGPKVDWNCQWASYWN